MKGDFKATDPDEVQFTVTITATLKEWKDIQLSIGAGKGWAPIEFHDVIGRLVKSAEKELHVYSPTTSEEEAA